MEKKQKDFQKVKLKVGKHLPRGRNETKTSFQTRKINLQQQIKEAAGEPTLKELLRYMKSTDAKIKFDNMRRLFKYISNNKDTLPLFFADVLKELGRTLQESDPKIRSEAILILSLCAEILTDIQLNPFITPLTTYLNCMMTHIIFQVKLDALKFLDVLLKTHCSVICHSHEILFYLLNLISCKESGNTNDGRKLHEFVTSKISTDEWRMNVLERMLTFLSEVLKKDSIEVDIDDSKTVYWDGKERLYLPLYLNSGTKPAKFDYSLYEEACDFKKIKTFVRELLPILRAILKGFPVRRSISEANIKYLNIITQIMCCIGENVENIDLKNDDSNISKEMRTIGLKLMDKFPYINQAGDVSKGQEVDCLNLNLGICCFYSIYYFHFQKSQVYMGEKNKIRSYIKDAVEAFGARLSEKSISLILKISKIALKTNIFDRETTRKVLCALNKILNAIKISPGANEIYFFFMDLTLDSDVSGINDLEPIKEWFSKLLDHLFAMMDTNTFVPNYRSYLKQLCARRNTYFMNFLGVLSFKKFIDLLRFDNQDLQLTAIQMIVSRSNLTPEFLQDIAEAISDECFSLKTASRLIRCLHSRFLSKDLALYEQVEFVKFLLNLACDTFLILDPTLDADPMPLKGMLVDFQKSFSSRCEIYPTTNFEFQHEIFKVCAELLPPYLRNEFHVKAAIIFIRTIFDECSRYPLHSAVAFVELFKQFPILNSDKESADFLQNIIYSCLLYTSLFTADIPEEHWDEYNVAAVQSCFYIVNTLDIICYMDDVVYSFQEKQIFHILRILLLLKLRGCFQLVQKDPIFLLLSNLNKHEVVCAKSDFKNVVHYMYDYLCNI